MKIDTLNKEQIIEYCQTLGIETEKLSKQKLIEAIDKYYKEEIKTAIQNNTSQDLLEKKITALSQGYKNNLKAKIIERKDEMKLDDNAHYLIYQVLGISEKEGKLIDEYQNTGRFLYKYAGSFLEEASIICLTFKNVAGGKTNIPNNQGQKPKTFEIDFLDGNNAFEIKWRDATTDGDHISKEHSRVKAIQSQGYKPIRLMFYEPQRMQAKQIQEKLKAIYKSLAGEYYAGENAYNFIKKYTGYDLKVIITKIAKEN